MKTKRILSIMILLLALPTVSFAASVYYDPGSGGYYTVGFDAYGNRVLTPYDNQVYYNEGLPYDNTYYNPNYYNNYYPSDNYYPSAVVPALFFSIGGGGYREHGEHGEHGDWHHH